MMCVSHVINVLLILLDVDSGVDDRYFCTNARMASVTMGVVAHWKGYVAAFVE